MRIWVPVVILFFFSCRVADTALVGQYQAKSYHRSIIIVDSNKQFKFSNDGYEFLLSGENFIYTQGSWTRSEDKLFLTSISDSIPTPRFGIAKRSLNGSNKSKFVFLDLNNDSVLIYSVFKNNKLIFARPHGPFLASFEDSATRLDTLIFTFTWGFKPVQLAIDSNAPGEYTCTLNREFKPDYFRNTEFLIRKNKLIRITDKTKFRKTKSKCLEQ